MEEIPVIDIGPFLAGGDPTPAVEAIREACTRVGFLQITGHGVAPETLDAVYRSMEEVVALPWDVKATLASPTGHPFRGLCAYRSEPAGTVLVERLQVNRFDDGDDAVAAGVDAAYADYFHPNVWPPQAPGLRDVWWTCFEQTRALGERIMSLFALALDLPAEFFTAMLRPDVSTFSVNAYPPRPLDGSAAADPAVILFEHSDSGTLTVLHQRGDYAGLQIQLLDGRWINVPVRPDAFVINIGDLMARWTNDRWRSTRHRVVAADDATASRMSITTFHLPAIDTVISPLPTCVGDDQSVYEPVTPYVWESMFLAKTY